MKKLFALFFSSFLMGISAQKAHSFKLKKYEIANLNERIQETSALNFFQGKLYTLNDSGNTSELFEIDSTNGTIINVLQTGLSNRDWEALSSDDRYFYIGDFGNNAGTRKDLKIYKVPLKNEKIEKDSIKTISFSYPEQSDFSPKNLNNNFDAESLISIHGNLHVFTKEWTSKGVSHYVVNANIQESQAAVKTEYFKTDFVVTDASYYEGKLYVVGYTKLAAAYLMIFEESRPSVFFEKEPKKFHVGTAFSVGQIEGITVNENGIYISAEAFSSPLGKTKPRLYHIPKKAIQEYLCNFP